MLSIKVLIADATLVYRTQIRTALQAFAWIEVVATASNGRLAMECLRKTPVDLMILDLEMHDMNGLQILAEMNRQNIQVKTLVFSSASIGVDDLTFEAYRLGAYAFVMKPRACVPDIVKQKTRSDPCDHIRELLEPALQVMFRSK